MTDITELAQRMKAAAVRAKAATEDYVAHRMSITVCLSECAEFNDLSDGPDNILALVEALEKVQRANAAQGDHIEQQQDRIEQLEKGNQYAAKHIAELESRTVKLPNKNIGWDRDEDDCWNNAIDACAEALTEQGIKWEAE